LIFAEYSKMKGGKGGRFLRRAWPDVTKTLKGGCDASEEHD